LNIQLTLKHQSKQVDALAKIAALPEQLMRESFPGVTIENPGHRLSGNTFSFWFTGKKDKNSMMVTGTIVVTATDVVFTIMLPDAVKHLNGFNEAKVKDVLTQRFNALFNIK